MKKRDPEQGKHRAKVEQLKQFFDGEGKKFPKEGGDGI